MESRNPFIVGKKGLVLKEVTTACLEWKELNGECSKAVSKYQLFTGVQLYEHQVTTEMLNSENQGALGRRTCCKPNNSLTQEFQTEVAEHVELTVET